LTFATPPGETTHSVQRIWRAHGLQPHRIRQFKLSQDPEFVGKLRDVVGLYVDPPAHVVVLSVDEKSQIQALDRTQPRAADEKGRARTMTTHDYKRHGTTTLFAAMNVLDGTVIGRNMQRHHTRSSFAFSTQLGVRSPRARPSTPSSTITLLTPLTSKPRSIASSTITTPIPNPSNGSPIQTKLPPPSNQGIKR
jgi:hypothetical protein